MINAKSQRKIEKINRKHTQDSANMQWRRDWKSTPYGLYLIINDLRGEKYADDENTIITYESSRFIRKRESATMLREMLKNMAFVSRLHNMGGIFNGLFAFWNVHTR